jgi:2-amino-4-hydroxy-6-hydroxymethyldihydropteridine diphosphokinase
MNYLFSGCLSMSTLLAYVGLGSNLGDKKVNLEQGLDLLGAVPGIRLLRVAPLYHTAPMELQDQDWFLNTVTELETTLSPMELLEMLLALEDQMGRVRWERWGPRVIDLDLLLHGSKVLITEKLTLPHPRMHQRAFVMVPLADLSPELIVPGHGQASDLAVQLQKEQTLMVLE